jgi:hypothetical protein
MPPLVGSAHQQRLGNSGIIYEKQQYTGLSQSHHTFPRFRCYDRPWILDEQYLRIILAAVAINVEKITPFVENTYTGTFSPSPGKLEFFSVFPSHFIITNFQRRVFFKFF